MACFLATAKRGQPALVANNLALTPAASSKSVRRMEVQLGAALLERALQGIRLSASGSLLVERVMHASNAYEEAVRYASNVRAGRAALIRLGPFTAVFETWIATSLAQPQPRRPAMRARIIAMESSQTMSHRCDRKIDRTVVHSNGPMPHDMTASVLAHDTSVPALRSGHSLLSRAALKLADRLGCSWIFPPNQFIDHEAMPLLFATGDLSPTHRAAAFGCTGGCSLSMLRASEMIAAVPRSARQQATACGIRAREPQDLVLDCKVPLAPRARPPQVRLLWSSSNVLVRANPTQNVFRSLPRKALWPQPTGHCVTRQLACQASPSGATKKG